MNFIEQWQFQIIERFYPIIPGEHTEPKRRSLAACFGEDFAKKIPGKVVVDFGCGLGADTKEMANWGAKAAIGLELREELVEANRASHSMANCHFHQTLPEVYHEGADLVISVDAFEHFEQPALMLKLMHNTLRPGGLALINFGPTWLHPYGGHLFSVFPWAHLILSEKALIKWRNKHYQDGATSFTEVAGGLNKMTIAQFEKLVAESPFEMIKLECIPLRNKAWLQALLGRELATGAVNAVLRKKSKF